jgi:tRNA (guanine-N7-)-methyltransferase
LKNIEVLKNKNIFAGASPERLELGDWWKLHDLPVNWDELFPGGPLNVEVGFGKGELLLDMAQKHPDARYIGMERYAKGHRKLLGSARQKGFKNLISMVGDAYILMNIVFEDSSLEQVICNFSDPWPKSRHARRRLYTSEFFTLVCRKLKTGGGLAIATDDIPYSIQALEALRKTEGLVSTHSGSDWLSESPHPVRSRYEQKWIEEDRELRYFLYRKGGNSAALET